MKKYSSHLIISAIAALSLTTTAHAQFLINNGNAADANTRAGSYGSNGYDNGRPINSATVNGNQIVTGNVTGGRALQTNTGYFAPGQLETTTGSEQMQDFIRDSTGVPQPYQQSQPGYLAPQAFYGGSTTAAPPAGFVRNTNTGSFVPATPAGPQMSYDTRVGLLNPTGISPADAGLTSSQSIIPQTSIVSGAQLYGPTVTPGDEQQSSPFNNAYRQWNQQDQQQLNQSNIAQMRSELDQSQSASSGNNNANARPGVTPDSLSPQSLSPTSLNPSANALAQSSQGPSNGTSAQQTNTALATPAQQSAQYAQLQQRFKQFGSGTPAAPSATTPGTPGESTPETTPSTPSQPNTPEENARLRANLYPPSVPSSSSSPLLIHSLAVGIHAKGLRQVMADAEEHMRQGRYAEAMIRYAAAAQVAPNNTLIPLGRSFAELGAGYYVRADHDLRGALMTDSVLLMGRYDLKNLLGESRLEFIVRDLKQITVSDKQNTDAPFLLAYIAYNSGSSTAAGEYLDLTEQRSNASIPLIGLMRQYWNLPAAKK